MLLEQFGIHGHRIHPDLVLRHRCGQQTSVCSEYISAIRENGIISQGELFRKVSILFSVTELNIGEFDEYGHQKECQEDEYEIKFVLYALFRYSQG